MRMNCIKCGELTGEYEYEDDQDDLFFNGTGPLCEDCYQEFMKIAEDDNGRKMMDANGGV